MGSIPASRTKRGLDMHAFLEKRIPQIAAICEQHGVTHLELFGSATGDQFDPQHSDYDFLADLNHAIPGSRASRWIALAEALEALLGRPVDLVNPKYIRNPYFLKSVNDSRTVIYERQSAQTVA